MAFKKAGTSTTEPSVPGDKKYWWRSAELGNGMSEWHYVTTDADTTVEVVGYFNDSEIKEYVRPGDRVWVLRVTSIDDTRDIQADCQTGIVDVSLHYVVSDEGATVNITSDVLVATVTYTS